jgi:hypothetical protein
MGRLLRVSLKKLANRRVVAYRAAYWRFVFLIGLKVAQYIRVVKQESQQVEYICM